MMVLALLAACGGPTEPTFDPTVEVHTEAVVPAPVAASTPLPQGAPWPPVVVPVEPERDAAFDWPFAHRGATVQSEERRTPTVQEMNALELADEPGGVSPDGRF